jgi:hypothetical protein
MTSPARPSSFDMKADDPAMACTRLAATLDPWRRPGRAVVLFNLSSHLKEFAMSRALSITTLALALAGACFTVTAADAAMLRVLRHNAEGGATAARAGTTTRNADGSASHRGEGAAEGARGSVESTGSATRSADGQVTQGRTTTVTNAATGNSAQTTGSYSSDGGRNRTTACFNSAGASIACPSRP